MALRIPPSGLDKVRESGKIEGEIDPERATEEGSIVGADCVPIEHLGIALDRHVELVPESSQVERVYLMNIDDLLRRTVDY